jgi:hypothetical protein
VCRICSKRQHPMAPENHILCMYAVMLRRILGKNWNQAGKWRDTMSIPLVRL